MKILHVVASLSPEWGGPVAVVSNLVRTLIGLGIECSIVAPVGPKVGTNSVAIEGADVRLFKANALSYLWPGYSPALGEELRREIPRYDLVHIHELWHFPHWAAASSAWACGTPFVISPRGQLSPWALSHKGWAKLLVSGLFQRRVLGRASAVHALSEDEAAQIREYGIDRRVFVIPNATDHEWSHTAAPLDRFYERFPELSDKELILFLGRIHPIKGVDMLVQAFGEVARTVPRAHLLIVGPDETRGVGQLRRLAASLGIEARITFAGPLYGAEKHAALRAARVFVLPSRSEGQSSALLEAMAAGLPVVVTAAANRPDVREAGAGLVAPLDPPKLAGAIEQLLLDRDLARTMGKNGRRLVLEQFTWDTVARQVADMYRSAAAQGDG